MKVRAGLLADRLVLLRPAVRGRVAAISGPLGLVAVAVAAIGYNLGGAPLGDWDEGIYAEVARELGVTGDAVIMHWNFAPFFDKPPLFFWLTAVSYHYLGVSELAARLPSAAAGVGTVLVTYATARRYVGRAAAILAALVLLLCIQWMAAARYGTTDALLAFFGCLLVFAYLAAADDRRWWFVAGAALGLGVMVKGAAGLVVPAAVLGSALVDGRGRELRSRWCVAALLACLVIALPWHVAGFVRAGPGFLDQYLGYHVLRRASAPIEGHTGSGWLTYLAFMRHQFFPWFYLAPFGVIEIARRRGSWAIVLVPAAVLVCYTLVRSKLIWYTVPAYPALAVLCAVAIEAAVRRRSRVAIAGVVAAAAAAVVSVPNVLGPYPPWWVLPFAAAALGLTLWRPSRRLAVVPLVAFLALVSAHYLTAIYPAVRPAYIAPVKADLIPVAVAAGRDDPGAPLLYYDPGVPATREVPMWPDLLFYSRRRVVPTRVPPPRGDVVAPEADARALGVHDLTCSGRYCYGRR